MPLSVLPERPAHRATGEPRPGLPLTRPPVDFLGMRVHPPASDVGLRSLGPIRVFRLGAEPGDDLSATTTPEERVSLVWELSRRLWALTGQTAPMGPRNRLPIRVIRRA